MCGPNLDDTVSGRVSWKKRMSALREGEVLAHTSFLHMHRHTHRHTHRAAATR